MTLAAAVVVSWLAGSANSGGVWFGAAVAYGLQLIAFALLLLLRDQQFMAGVVGGMLLRVAVLIVCAIWLGRTNALPRAATLLSLVGFMFVLVLLESVFVRFDRRTT